MLNLKPHSDPYGYKKLLVYTKADELQQYCAYITQLFPRAKTEIALADQMNRSARSGKQNIVEGWKRNTTREYFEFLGFSIGAIAELEEDCNDVLKGVYRELMGIKGLMGEGGIPLDPLNPIKPILTLLEIEKLKFYPLDQTLPPIVQLKLRCKELNFLLTKLQGSLTLKMDQENTLKTSDKSRLINKQELFGDQELEKVFVEAGLVKLSNGQFAKKADL